LKNFDVGCLGVVWGFSPTKNVNARFRALALGFSAARGFGLLQ
jgi:hypothetical protein